MGYVKTLRTVIVLCVKDVDTAKQPQISEQIERLTASFRGTKIKMDWYHI